MTAIQEREGAAPGAVTPLRAGAEGVTTAGDAGETCPPGAGEVFCGVAAAAELLGDAWTLLLVRDLANGPRRFKELEASTRISPRVLTDRLRALTAKGMLTRTMYAEIPPRVEYELTEKGRDVLPIIDSLRDYGMRWLHPGGPLGEPAASGD